VHGEAVRPRTFFPPRGTRRSSRAQGKTPTDISAGPERRLRARLVALASRPQNIKKRAFSGGHKPGHYGLFLPGRRLGTLVYPHNCARVHPRTHGTKAPKKKEQKTEAVRRLIFYEPTP